MSKRFDDLRRPLDDPARRARVEQHKQLMSQGESDRREPQQCWKCHGLPFYDESRRDYVRCPVCGGSRKQAMRAEGLADVAARNPSSLSAYSWGFGDGWEAHRESVESELQEALDVIAAQLEPLDWVADIDESGLSQEDAERIAKDILTAFGALLARHGRHKGDKGGGK